MGGRRAAWLVQSPLLLGSFIGTLSNNIVNVPLKQILGGLHVPLSLGFLVVVSFNVTFAALMPVTGWAGDHFGRRRVFCAALATLAVGSAGAALAPDLALLVVFRVIQGAGTAAILPNVMTLTTQIYGPERRGRGLGLWSAANGLGQASAPLLSGTLAGWLSWRAVFWPTVPLAALALVAALRLVPRTPPGHSAIEWRGATSITLAAGLLLSAAAMVPVGGSALVVAAPIAVAGLVAAWAYLRASHRFDPPFLPPSLLSEPSFLRSSVAVIAQMFCFASIMLAVPLNLAADSRISPVAVGLYLFALPATMTVLAPLSGLAIDAFGPRRTIRLGLVILTAALAGLGGLLSHPAHASAALVGLLVLAGCGVALVQTPAATGATRSSAGRLGAGIGLFNLLRFAGSALGGCWVAVVLSSGNLYGLLFAGSVVVALVGLAATWAGTTPATASAEATAV